MNSKLNHSILALTVLAVLSGCASEPTDENRPEKVNGTMNQPKVEKLVVVDESARKAKEQTHKSKTQLNLKSLRTSNSRNKSHSHCMKTRSCLKTVHLLSR